MQTTGFHNVIHHKKKKRLPALPFCAATEAFAEMAISANAYPGNRSCY